MALSKVALLTRPDQLRDMAVAGDFPGWDLLDRAVDGVEERGCFVGPGHLCIKSVTYPQNGE